MDISRSIVRSIRHKGGRFLDKDPVTSILYDVGDRKAIEKTSQALRDGAAELRKQLSEDLRDPEFIENLFDVDQSATETRNEEPTKDKPIVTKAKKIVKGHRRTHSNPESLSMTQRRKIIRKINSKGMPESPMDKSASDESQAHSQPYERVLASQRLFDAFHQQRSTHNYGYFSSRHASIVHGNSYWPNMQSFGGPSKGYVLSSFRGGYTPMTPSHPRIPIMEGSNSFSSFGEEVQALPVAPALDRCKSYDDSFFLRSRYELPVFAMANTSPAFTSDESDTEKTWVTPSPIMSRYKKDIKQALSTSKESTSEMKPALVDIHMDDTSLTPLPFDIMSDDDLLDFSEDDLLMFPIDSLETYCEEELGSS